MSDAAAQQPEVRGRPIGLVALLAITALGVIAILVGQFCSDPDVRVFYYDAGPIDSYDVGEPRSFPQIGVFVIALDDDGTSKHLRALDGRAPGTGCTVQLNPDDARGRTGNPLQRPGTFSDPCSQAVWFLSGDALSGTGSALRVFVITQPPPEDAEGRRIVEVEVLGRDDPRATPTPDG